MHTNIATLRRSFPASPDLEQDEALPVGHFMNVLEEWIFQIAPAITQMDQSSQSDQLRLSTKAKVDADLLIRSITKSAVRAQSVVERQELIGLCQSLLHSLLADLNKQETEPLAADLIPAVQNEFAAVVEYLRSRFPQHFDYSQLVPAALVVDFASTVENRLVRLNEGWVNEDEVGNLFRQWRKSLEDWLYDVGRKPDYTDIQYIEHLLHRIEALPASSTTDDLRKTLIVMNFNERWFIETELERLVQLASAYDTPKQRAAVLRFEQKQFNQMPLLSSHPADQTLPSFEDQMNHWIDEEVKFLESGYAVNVAVAEGQPTEKIQTSLSVAKLAVIIRLLVLDKIIINRAAAPMLRVVAKVFTTLQKDEIAFGSLETKYHAPDKATVNVVRDMLFKWINILGKL